MRRFRDAQRELTCSSDRTSYACCRAANRFVAPSMSSWFLSGWWMRASLRKDFCVDLAQYLRTVQDLAYPDLVRGRVLVHLEQSIVIWRGIDCLSAFATPCSRFASSHLRLGLWAEGITRVGVCLVRVLALMIKLQASSLAADCSLHFRVLRRRAYRAAQ